MRRLTDILDELNYHEEIDFMSIDVEMLEGEVLQGLDFDKYRPKVVLLESTIPNTHIESYDWEYMLLNK